MVGGVQYAARILNTMLGDKMMTELKCICSNEEGFELQDVQVTEDTTINTYLCEDCGMTITETWTRTRIEITD